MPLSLPFGACCLFCIYPSKYHMVMHFSSCLTHSLRSAVHPKGAKEVTAGAWTSMDSLYPAMKKRRKSTAITWRRSEGEREREAEQWKQGDKEGYLPLRTTWIQIQKCCPKADLPLVCWGMDSRDQQLTLHFRRVGRTRGGDGESVTSSCFGLYPEREVWT